MKIKFLAVFDAPDSYDFNGDILKYTKDGVEQELDLTDFSTDDKFEGLEDKEGNYISYIRGITRDKNNELNVVLTQKYSGSGDWQESDWMDSSEYKEGVQYITKV